MLLDFIGYGIIPIYTIMFAYNSNLFTSNFSVISQFSNRQLSFIIWGILIGSYFYYLLKGIILTVPNNKREQRLLSAAALFLLISINLPYAPERYPFESLMHVICACITALIFMVCLYMIIIKLYYRKRFLYRPYTIAIISITVISLILLFSAGIISSALEIFFIISSSILLRRLYQTAHFHDRGNYT